MDIDYKSEIVEMLDAVKDLAVLRLIYGILIRIKDGARNGL